MIDVGRDIAEVRSALVYGDDRKGIDSLDRLERRLADFESGRVYVELQEKIAEGRRRAEKADADVLEALEWMKTQVREAESEAERLRASVSGYSQWVKDLRVEVERLQEDVANREAHHDDHHREAERLRALVQRYEKRQVLAEEEA